mmetsp:Transcript_16903/g.25434  ORF Transcript_16903/g.25434 Transcript_16903/m.25434 type:complete len:260 (-) Transcript_16903:64-843(-)
MGQGTLFVLFYLSVKIMVNEALQGGDKSSSIRYIFARHGETDFNAEGRIQGCLESRLTLRGLEQAAILGHYIAMKESKAISQVFCSPMIRARQTLAIINGTCVAIGQRLPEAAIHYDLREIELGEWQGQLKSELRESGEWQKWQNNPENFRLGDTLPLRNLWERAKNNWQFIRGELKTDDMKKTILIVAHGALGRCMIASALGYDIDSFRNPNFALDNCELVEILWSPDAPSAHSFQRVTTFPLGETDLQSAGAHDQRR